MVKQYQELLKTEKVSLEFTREAIEEIALFAEEVNERAENIGARRLHTIMEKLLEEISFDAAEMAGVAVKVTPEMVQDRLKDIVKSDDLSRYIL